jgi:hypothetical protein
LGLKVQQQFVRADQVRDWVLVKKWVLSTPFNKLELLPLICYSCIAGSVLEALGCDEIAELPRLNSGGSLELDVCWILHISKGNRKERKICADLTQILTLDVDILPVLA